jgi:uncharacterized protein YjdB
MASYLREFAQWIIDTSQDVAKAGQGTGGSQIPAGGTKPVGRDKDDDENPDDDNVFAIQPANPHMYVGQKGDFVCVYSQPGGFVPNSWSSSKPSVLVIDNEGHATALAIGRATITASVKSLGPLASTEVTVAAVKSIAVVPQGVSVFQPTKAQQFTARAALTDGVTYDGWTDCVWTSSNPKVASVDAHTGVVDILSFGSATITAKDKHSGQSGTAEVKCIKLLTVKSIAVTPAELEVRYPKRENLSATATLDDGNTFPKWPHCVWSSSAPKIASVDSNTGEVVVYEVGDAVITAKDKESGILGTAKVTFKAPGKDARKCKVEVFVTDFQGYDAADGWKVTLTFSSPLGADVTVSAHTTGGIAEGSLVLMPEGALHVTVPDWHDDAHTIPYEIPPSGLMRFEAAQKARTDTVWAATKQEAAELLGMGKDFKLGTDYVTKIIGQKEDAQGHTVWQYEVTHGQQGWTLTKK